MCVELSTKIDEERGWREGALLPKVRCTPGSDAGTIRINGTIQVRYFNDPMTRATIWLRMLIRGGSLR
jgi:hypothetical protein